MQPRNATIKIVSLIDKIISDQATVIADALTRGDSVSTTLLFEECERLYMLKKNILSLNLPSRLLAEQTNQSDSNMCESPELEAVSSISSQLVINLNIPSDSTTVIAVDAQCPEVGLNSGETLFVRDRISSLNIGKLSTSWATPLQLPFGQPITDAHALALIHTLPAEILDLPVASLPFGTRLKNVLIRNGIKNLKSLSYFGPDQLASLKYMGRTCLEELYEWLRKSERVALSGSTHSGSTQATGSRTQMEFIDPGQLHVHNTNDEPSFVDLLKEVFVHHLADKRLRMVVNCRIGCSMTLQETGDKLGVTRERVRQLEKKAFKVLERTAHSSRLNSRVKALFETRTKPLHFALIGMEDKWFRSSPEELEQFGIPNAQVFIIYLICSLCPQLVHRVQWEETWILSRITQSEFDNLLQEFRRLIDNHVITSYDDLLPRIRRFAEDNSVPDLQDILLDLLKREYVNISNQNGLFKLTRLQSIDSAVQVVLEGSKVPMHYSEVTKICRQLLNREVDERRVLNILQESAYLYERGKYGLLKHLNMNNEEIAEMGRFLKILIDSGNVDRQWHCHELLELLPPEIFSDRAYITSYIVNICLSICDVARGLNRMIWVHKDSDDQSTADRTNIADAAEQILENAGAPLTNQELLARFEERGLKKKYQFQPTDRMIRIERGVWGLLDRDVSLDVDTRNYVLGTLYRIMQLTNQPIHVSRIAELLREEGVVMDANPVLVASLAQHDGRFRLTRSEFLVLSLWDDVQPLSISSAVKLLLQDSDKPLKIAEVTQRVSGLTGVSVTKQRISNLLLAIGAKFDRTAGGWIRPEHAPPNW